MNISTFKDDLLGLQDFAKRLERFIDTEHDFVEGGLVVSLNSKFGSGKSTFLKMWLSELENGEYDQKRIVISLNAWESDYNGDPLFSIISALAETLRKKGENTNKLLEAAKDFGWFVTTIGSQVANKFTGIDPVSAGGVAEKKKMARRETLEKSDAFSIYEKRKHAMDSLKNAISDIVSSVSPKVLFLVDELDRCRPDYAITYLETIKHLFDTKGAVFILAADRQQLENSAKTAFGIDLDFEEYYRKFVHREVMLPSIPEIGYQKLASQYVNYYLERKGSRFCFMELSGSRINEITTLVAGLKLTPRQIQEIFRTLGHLFETTEAKKGSLLWCLSVGSVAMAAFKIGAPKIFHSLGKQKLEPADGLSFLHSINLKHSDWWLSLFYTGGGLHIKEDESYESLINRLGLDSINPNKDLGQFRSGWGHGYNRFSEIYEKIQLISQWK